MMKMETVMLPNADEEFEAERKMSTKCISSLISYPGMI